MHPDIEAYLNGELQGEALEQFETALARDPALREEVEALRPLVRDLQRAAIARRVATAERNRTAKRRVRRIVTVLLCGMLLGLGGIWWLWKSGQQDISPLLQQPDSQKQQDFSPAIDKTLHEQANAPVDSQNKDGQIKSQEKKEDKNRLFAAWFKPYKDEKMEPMYRGDGDNSPYEQFHIFYWDGKYREALKTFESLEPFEKNNDNTLFIKANCLLALNRADEAATLLEKISRNKRSRFGGEAEWYLALSYLKSGQSAKARVFLQTLENTPGTARQRDAASLLKELD